MSKNLKVVLGIIACIFLVAVLWQIRTIIYYVIISGILSLLASPLVKFLNGLSFKGIKLPNSVTAALTLVLMLCIFVGFISFFAPMIVAQAKAISQIDVVMVTQKLQDPIEEFDSFMANYSLSDEKSLDFLESKIVQVLNLTNLSNLFNGVFNVLGNVFIAFFSILFITFFFLKEQGLFFKMILMAVPDNFQEKAKKILGNTKYLLTRYFVGILIQITSITTLVTIGLHFLEIENALVIGLFAGIINVIPYLGPLIGAIIGLVLSATTNLHIEFYADLMPLLVKVALIFAIVQLLDNFVFQPLIFSNSVNAHPLEIFIVIFISGTIAGIAGMILAIPVYTILRIVAKEFLSNFKIVQSLTKNI